MFSAVVLKYCTKYEDIKNSIAEQIFDQVSPVRVKSRSLLRMKQWVEWEEVWQQDKFLTHFFTYFTVIERKTLAQVE